MVRKSVPSSDLTKYTVGWICALPVEMAAARAMLDEEHGKPEHFACAGDIGGAADGNNYFLGSIGGHNIVLACLPLGSTGSASAATVAMHMQRTFTGVRIGLLIGIGSGVPSAAHDIRLGDVVVSTPTDGTGGVIQYDRLEVEATDGNGGKSSSSSSSERFRFVRARCLNKPPTMLCTALSSLQSEHAVHGSRACELLAAAAARYPRLQTSLAVPMAGGQSNCDLDQLFRASYVHSPDSRRNTCDRCDASMLVQRPRRPAEDGGPTVHYGVVASSELEIACGVSRDAASTALGGLMCFEREAAGLMDNFPCLVVRGVSDYADSHKNALWRSYAAATAAAFAKELLENMPPREVEQTRTIAEAMREGITLQV
jgi:nucleoside phosphorylase